MTTSNPVTIDSRLLPTVRNLREARDTCHLHPAVLTVGPALHEVDDFAHPDHKVVTFDDITAPQFGYVAPTIEHVAEALHWGTGRTDLLVHCHAGMSRSTSTAWGIAIANGYDPQLAYDLLRQRHPVERWSCHCERRAFIPNELVLEHLETLLGLAPETLRDIAIIGGSDDLLDLDDFDFDDAE